MPEPSWRTGPRPLKKDMCVHFDFLIFLCLPNYSTTSIICRQGNWPVLARVAINLINTKIKGF